MGTQEANTKKRCLLRNLKLTVSCFLLWTCLSCYLPTSGNKSMQEKESIEKHNNVEKPCSEIQCKRENSHRNLIQPFIRCPRRKHHHDMLFSLYLLLRTVINTNLIKITKMLVIHVFGPSSTLHSPQNCFEFVCAFLFCFCNCDFADGNTKSVLN